MHPFCGSRWNEKKSQEEDLRKISAEQLKINRFLSRLYLLHGNSQGLVSIDRVHNITLQFLESIVKGQLLRTSTVVSYKSTSHEPLYRNGGISPLPQLKSRDETPCGRTGHSGSRRPELLSLLINDSLSTWQVEPCLRGPVLRGSPVTFLCDTLRGKVKHWCLRRSVFLMQKC